MADHLIACPFCQGQLTVSDDQAGMQLACPHCNGEFHLQAQSSDDGGNVPLPIPDKVPFFGASRRKLFGEHFEHLAADGILSASDKAHLVQVAAQLNLSESEVNKVQGELFMAKWKPIQERLNASMYLTDEDLREIDALKRQYGVTVENEPSVKLARERWLIDEKGFLPPPFMRTSAILQSGESAYLEAQTTWHQMRSVRKGYVGGSVGVRLAKGVRISVGRAIPICSQELTALSSGDLVVTDKRLLFQGAHRSTSILLGRITGIELFREGLMIHKDRGLSDLFSMPVINSAYLESLIRSLIERR